MGSEQNSILPEPRGDVVQMLHDFFPMDIRDFFQNYYDTEMILLKQNETKWDPDKLWKVSEFEKVYESFTKTGQHTSQITVHPRRDEHGNRQQKTKLQSDSSFSDLENLLHGGASFVLRYEHLPEKNRPMFELETALNAMSGIPTSIHLYVSSPGAKVLEAHTDPYDVLVFQVKGSKNWTACVPVEEVGLRCLCVVDASKCCTTTPSSRHFFVLVLQLASLKYQLRRKDISQAQLCMLQELMIGKIEGCNVYSAEDTEDLRV